jgi:hypothetical protein
LEFFHAEYVRGLGTCDCVCNSKCRWL